MKSYLYEIQDSHMYLGQVRLFQEIDDNFIMIPIMSQKNKNVTTRKIRVPIGKKLILDEGSIQIYRKFLNLTELKKKDVELVIEWATRHA